MNKRIFLSAVSALVILLLFLPVVSAAEESAVTIFSVTSSPSGATATYLATGESHTTPCSFTIRSGSAAWGQETSISISKAGYETEYEPVTADDFEDYIEETTYSVTVSLTPIYEPTADPTAEPAIQYGSTTFYVSSYPSGAKAVFQSTGESGTTPCSFTIHSGTAAWGRATSIVVSKSGYETDYFPIDSYDFQYDIPCYIDITLDPVYQDGYLSLSSSPSSASAYVDGSYVGTTPLDIPVPQGYHTVNIKKSGYTSWSGSATVDAGQIVYLSGTLTPIQTSGTLAVSSNPSHADVYINGVYKGQTPTQLTLSEGSYSIDVRKSGYKSYITTSYVSSGSSSSVYAELSSNPSTGSLKIASFPAGASVYIDNTYVGRTPTSSSPSNPNYMVAGPFSAGTTHTLSLQLANYQSYTTSFKLAANEVKLYTVTLNPATPAVTTASINAISTPSGADLFIDNTYYGNTPYYSSNIQPGTHTVRMAASGYNDWIQTCSFASGQTMNLNAVLTQGGVVPTPTPTQSPLPFAGILAGLGAAAVILCLRKD